MCGIVGYIATDNGKFEKARRGFLKYALMLDTIRGQDSTGVMTISKKFTVNRYKTLAPGFAFAPSKKFEETVPNGWCTVGHNRAATIGDVEINNAHPFKFGKVSLVHNGTLNKHGSSFPTYDKDLAVDSMQIARALSSVAAKDAKEILEYIDGDFAIVWIDERDRSINMARNAARPMHISFNYDRSLMLFMSDGEHLEVISKALRNSAAYTPTIYSLDTYQWLKWKQRGTLRPEVTRFAPFLRAKHLGETQTSQIPATTTPRTRIGTSGITTRTKPHLSAREVATKTWGNTEEEKSGNIPGTMIQINGDRYPINRNLSGRSFGMPTKCTPAHKAALEKFFSITPDMLISFQPEDFYELNDKLYQVVGGADIWGGGEWEGTINFVNKAQADAYNTNKWLVRPIGVTRNWSVDTCPGLLLDLIHCDYDKWKQKQDNKEVGESKVSDLVADPDGRLINRNQMLLQIQDGCIQCGDELFIGQLHTYEYANEGRDVLCESCKWKQQFMT